MAGSKDETRQAFDTAHGWFFDALEDIGADPAEPSPKEITAAIALAHIAAMAFQSAAISDLSAAAEDLTRALFSVSSEHTGRLADAFNAHLREIHGGEDDEPQIQDQAADKPL